MKHSPSFLYEKFLAKLLLAMGVLISKPLIGPRNIHISLCDTCDHRCQMCLTQSPLLKFPKPYAGFMSREAFNRLIDSAVSLRAAKIMIAGSGEPFCHSQIMQCIEYIKKNSRLKVSIMTHGGHLTPTIAERLSALGLDELHLSLNAGNDKAYKLVHNIKEEGLFTKIVNSLSYLDKLKSANKLKRPKVTISFVITRQNISSIADLFAVSKNIRPAFIKFRPMFFMPAFLHLVPTKDSIDSLVKWFNRDELHRLFPNNLKEVIQSLRDSAMVLKEKERTKCFVGYYNAVILGDGGVKPCGNAFKTLGNINVWSFRDIWHSREYNDFRKAAVKHDKFPIKEIYCRYQGNCPDIFINKKLANFRLF